MKTITEAQHHASAPTLKASDYAIGDQIPFDLFGAFTEIGDSDSPTTLKGTFVITATGTTKSETNPRTYAIMRRLGAPETDLERFQVLCDLDSLGDGAVGTELDDPVVYAVSSPHPTRKDSAGNALWEPMLPMGKHTQAGPRLYHAVWLKGCADARVGEAPGSVLGKLLDRARAADAAKKQALAARH